MDYRWRSCRYDGASTVSTAILRQVFPTFGGCAAFMMYIVEECTFEDKFID
jgi:hypothetical protein